MTENKLPLFGIVVLDLTNVLSGPFATQILSDMGAEVIKVEKPSGDDSRNFGPFIKGKSSYFISLNKGKKSIVLDLNDNKEKTYFKNMCLKKVFFLKTFVSKIHLLNSFLFKQTFFLSLKKKRLHVFF